MITEEHQAYYDLIDTQIQQSLWEHLNGNYKREAHYKFIEPDSEKIVHSDPEEHQFRVDLALFIEHGFYVGACPKHVAEALSVALLNHGWQPT